MSERSSQPNQPIRKRVLVVTDDAEGARQMIYELRAQQLDLQMVVYDGEVLSELPGTPPHAILCFLTDYVEHSADIVEILDEHFAPRDVPVIGRISQGSRGLNADDLPFDSVLFAPVHAVQVAHRVSSIIRLGQMETEIMRRVQTLSERFGQSIELGDLGGDGPLRVLFVGKANPAYMAVVNALKGKNVNVTAAFTSFSAFDYLHENAFDCVIMNALEQSEPALTISQTMRRNPRLFHVPTLFLVDPRSFRDQEAAYRSGARDLISSDAEPGEIGGRILELANYHRLHTSLKAQFEGIGGADCTDPETGVFNSDFLSAHLSRVSRDLRRQDLPMTVLALKLVPSSHGHVAPADLRTAFTKATQLVAGLVRMQDIVARVDIDTLIVAFPEETEASIRTVLERMKGLIECAAFETTSGDKSPLTLEIEAAIIEQESHESADFLIGSAVRTVDQSGISVSKAS